MDARNTLKDTLERRRADAKDILLRLLKTPSENPPADTRALAEDVAAILQTGDGIEVEVHSIKPPICNVIAVLRGAKPGPRLVFSGHLDTFEIGDPAAWSANPLGERVQDRVYGRGAGDMKGGVAAQLMATLCLSEVRESLGGELVLCLTGDEQSGAEFGTAHLLEHHPMVRGDAMICADAGSPDVLRFGEKGTIWMTVRADGKAGHGAHTHLTENAIDRLMVAVSALKNLERIAVDMPPSIVKAMEKAAPVSELMNRRGELNVLSSITVNVGTFHGGQQCNLAASHAEASLDIRFPPGKTLASMKTHIANVLRGLPGISSSIDYELEVNATAPDAKIIRLVTAAGSEVLGKSPVSTMRVGSSDAALFRFKDIPSVVCGLTAHNMGNVDEFIEVKELEDLVQMYALSAFDFLSGSKDEN